MAIRTTPQAVKDILNKDYDSDEEPPLDGYIEAASSIVDDVVTCASKKGLTLSSSKLEILERWLSAHAYCLMDRTYKQRATLRASGLFDSQTGMHLEATTYGQMAMTLDPTGCLTAINSGNRVRAFWLGRRPSEQTDAVDRE